MCMAYLIELPSDDMDFRRYRPKVIVRLFVADIPCTDDLAYLPGHLFISGEPEMTYQELLELCWKVMSQRRDV